MVCIATTNPLASLSAGVKSPSWREPVRAFLFMGFTFLRELFFAFVHISTRIDIIINQSKHVDDVTEARKRIRERLSLLRDRRDSMEEMKDSAVRNSPEWCSAHSSFQETKEEIDFLEDLLSLGAEKNPNVEKEDNSPWYPPGEDYKNGRWY